MTKDVLKLIDTGMTALGLNYGFVEWKGKPVDIYFVGEYQEEPAMSEDGLQEADFILTGFTRGSWDDLETAKENIENYFYRDGRMTIASSGNAVVISYSNSFVVPTGDAELKRIEIHLDVKEWKVK